MRSVSIIGVGRLGGALALAFCKAGYSVENLIYRSEPGPETIAGLISPRPNLILFESLSELSSDIVFITSGDPEIASISSQIAKKVRRHSIIFHASGSLSSEILNEVAEIGCETGSMHPLVSISDPVRGSEQFAGAFFCVEGKANAVTAAREITENMGAKAFAIDTKHKPLYHASAVTASGHLVALIDIAVEMLSKCGLDPDDAKHILMPLVKSTVGNLENERNETALTGTFARADAAAFDRHFEALHEYVSIDILRVYMELGARSLDLADRAGQDLGNIQRMRNRILLALRTARC